MKTKSAFTIFIFALLLFVTNFAFADPPAFPPKAELTSYDVALVTLDAPVTLNVNGEKMTYEKAYLVRLHGTFPAGFNTAMELYLDSDRVEEFGGFSKGIYFLVYEKSKLDSFVGKTFFYRFQNDMMPEKASLGKVFKLDSFDLSKTISIAHGLTSK